MSPPPNSRTVIHAPGTKTSHPAPRRAQSTKAVSPAARSDSASTATAASKSCQAAEKASIRAPTSSSAAADDGSPAKGAKSRRGARR